jgi:hypothetical protein
MISRVLGALIGLIKEESEDLIGVSPNITQAQPTMCPTLPSSQNRENGYLSIGSLPTIKTPSLQKGKSNHGMNH